MSGFTQRHNDPDYVPLTGAATPRRRNVDVVFVEKSEKPKWAFLHGDPNDPSTWKDENGFYDFEVIGENPTGAWGFFGDQAVWPGDKVLGAHAHLAIRALTAESNPEHLRKAKLIGECEKPAGGVLGFTIVRGPNYMLPSDPKKRAALLAKQPPPIPTPNVAAADALRSAGSALSQLANALQQPQAA